MKISSLTIILPAFNEEYIIEKAISYSIEAAKQVATDYEIIVVDDGSRDQTKEIIKKVAQYEPCVKGIFLPHHIGYGRAISTGFYSARKEFVFYTDSDLPIDISKELPQAALLISDNIDAIIGYRINRRDIPLRRIYSIIYNSICRILLRIKVRDINFSCKLLRRKVFDNIKLFSNTVFIDAELLANFNLYGLKIKEFPATYISRKYGHSNFDSLFYAARVLIELLIFWVINYIIPAKMRGK